MVKSKCNIYSILLVFLFGFLNTGSAEAVELKGKITLLSGGMPATAILHSYGDESYTGTANIDKDGAFSFKVDVPKASLFSLRFLHTTYDVMLSAAEKTTTINIKLDGETLKDIGTEKSREDDAFKTFKALGSIYDPKLRSQFVNCENEDSCAKELHKLLSEYAHELSLIQQNFKGTYTADVLCKMRMPLIAKNVKSTADEFRKGFFENVDFSDSTIFNAPTYKDMIANYVDFLIEPKLSKENQFLIYFTEKIKPNPVVFRRSAGLLFDELVRKQKEKMLGMFITWYNTGTNKTAVNNPVMDLRLKNISRVMPGQTYTDAIGPDTAGNPHSLKEVVDRSKCTLLLFWASDCSHCREEMPFIKQYYEKYHAKGFDVFAISIEPDPEKWKKFVADKKLPWTNVLCGRTADPNPAIQYVSVSTPTMVLIDSKGTILHRFIPKSRLENHIIDALK